MILGIIFFMDRRIITFLRSNHVFSLAVANEKDVYSAPCFYVLDDEEVALIFASDPKTHHMRLALHNPFVAGSIHRCEKQISRIQGIQFLGELQAATTKQHSIYYKRFPIAKTMDPAIWIIKLKWIKMTDNTLGFKKKIIWQRE